MLRTRLTRICDYVLGGYAKDYLYRHPVKCIKAIRRHSEAKAKFSTVTRWPRDVSSFENLSFLFHHSQANYGVCLLAFDEAAYLYGVTKRIRSGRLAEIGRYKGGSTFLMAAALDAESVIDSYDVYLISSRDGEALDRSLQEALARYGLEERVRLHVQDSASVHPDEESYDLVFIDGDHTYEGAKRDFLHWRNAVKPGGHLLFHDAVKTRQFSKGTPGLQKLIPEIEARHADRFERVDAVGTLVHFRRRGR